VVFDCCSCCVLCVACGRNAFVVAVLIFGRRVVGGCGFPV
jgi:hypothetical protein